MLFIRETAGSHRAAHAKCSRQVDLETAPKLVNPKKLTKLSSTINLSRFDVVMGDYFLHIIPRI